MARQETKRRRRNNGSYNFIDSKNTYNGINIVREENFSTSPDLPVWTEEEGLPIFTGQKFPTEDMLLRADINRTMQTLISGDLQKTMQKFIFTFPDLDPIINQKIATITASLPLFAQIMAIWRELLHTCFKGVRIAGKDRPELWHYIDKDLDTLIENKFTCCDRLVTVIKSEGSPKMEIYDDKNIFISRTENNEYVYSLTNIYEDNEGKTFLEVMSFTPDNLCIRTLFAYNAGVVGDKLEEEVVDVKSDVYFSKNGAGNDVYGQPILGGCISAVCGVIRAFSTIANMVEHSREFLRITPQSALATDRVTGMTYNEANGTKVYDDTSTEAAKINHDYKYIAPELAIDRMATAMKNMVQMLQCSSGLSTTVLGFTDVLNSNTSGRAIIASSASTLILASGYVRDIKRELTYTVKNILNVIGENYVVDETGNVRALTSRDIDIVTQEPYKTMASILGIEDVVTD